MKIAFVNSPVGHSFDRRGSIPIGLAYIMSYLRENGIESDGIDISDSERHADELVAEYNLASYDLVGFSVYNESFFPTMQLAEAIKTRHPETFLLCGGPQATATHEAIIDRFHSIDGVIRREGEKPTLKVIEAIRDRTPLSAVPNLTYRADGQPVVNAELDALADLDSLPFPDAEFLSEQPYTSLTYYDAQKRATVPAITIATSRSCPYNCSFCGVLTIGRRYRSRSPENVVDEVDYFRKKDDIRYSHVYFSDANFFVKGQRALEIVEALHLYDDEITFSFGTRVNQLLKAEETIKQMIPLGLKFIEVGVESASPTVLERLSKGVKPEVNVAATHMLRRLGVEIALDFIMVDPATTLEDLELNMAFFRDCNFSDYYPVDHLYTSLGLYEGTPIRDFYEERRQQQFALGDLPDIEPLIEHPETLAFWRTTQSFRSAYQDQIDQVLSDAELILLDDAVKIHLKDRSAARFADVRQFQLDSMGLRHAPILFFEAVVHALRSGHQPQTVDDILPQLRFGSDAVPLQDLIGRVKASTDRLRPLQHV